MGEEYMNEEMADYMKDLGKRESRRGRDNTLTRKERFRKEYGNRGKLLNGLEKENFDKILSFRINKYFHFKLKYNQLKSNLIKKLNLQ